jgi:uncharacterized membrane protein
MGEKNMAILILGIIVFLGTHSLTMMRSTRAALIGSLGAGPFRVVYSISSIAGFVLIVWGFGQYRATGWLQIWHPPTGMRHLTILLMWFAFVALAASGPVPGRIRGWLRHPMLVAIKIWALAHLLANGDFGGMVLFLSFLIWAVIDRIAVKRRGDLGAPRVPSFTRGDAVALGGGTVAYIAMMLLHPYLIGVAVIPM